MSKLVSFWADVDASDSFYGDAAAKLVKRSETLEQDLFVQAFYGFEGYLEATRFKPTFILDCLERFGPVVWIDADSALVKPVDVDGEVPAFVFERGKPLGHLHFWPDNELSRSVLEAWIEKCVDWPGGDHTAMIEVLASFDVEWGVLPDGLAVYRLSSTKVKARDLSGLPPDWKFVV